MINSIRVGSKKVGENEPVYIIAEAGVNHNGSIEKAKKLIDIALKIKADAIKFQTFNTDKLLLKNAEKPEYQKKQDIKESQYNMLKKLELTKNDHFILNDYARDNNIDFLSTPYDYNSVDFLVSLGVSAIKLSSIEIVNHPFIDYVISKKIPIILSNGLSTEGEIKDVIELFKKRNSLGNLVLLHCHFNYPTKYENVNLRVMSSLREKYGILVGFSDHTPDLLAPIVATAMGASVIEKHFTLDNTLPGPDHSSSLNPNNFEKMIKKIRDAETILGSSIRKRTEAENQNLISRRSIIIRNDMLEGQIITEDNLIAMRPGDGVWPTYENYEKIIGKKVKHFVKKNTKFSWDMIQ